MSSTVPIKIGIIGGSGLDDPDILEGRTERYVDTPYGKPSDALILGKIKNVECVLLARHGRQHTIMPSNVNYQANIWALREEGCTHLLVTTACGSLREEIQPGDIVIIDQFIDRTTKRAQTLYDGQASSPPGVCHIPMAEPFCNRTREVLVEVARSLGVKCHVRGTMLTIEGPRFSSRAESLMFRQWGADVINMTTVPEVVLAKEAGLCYASIAMATDYDCWKEHEEAVCVDNVMKTMKENANKASSILLTAIPQISQMDWAQTMKTLKVSCQLYDESFPLSKSFGEVEKEGLFTLYLPILNWYLLFIMSSISMHHLLNFVSQMSNQTIWSVTTFKTLCVCEGDYNLEV